MSTAKIRTHLDRADWFEARAQHLHRLDDKPESWIDDFIQLSHQAHIERDHARNHALKNGLDFNSLLKEHIRNKRRKVSRDPRPVTIGAVITGLVTAAAPQRQIFDIARRSRLTKRLLDHAEHLDAWAELAEGLPEISRSLIAEARRRAKQKRAKALSLVI